MVLHQVDVREEEEAGEVRPRQPLAADADHLHDDLQDGQQGLEEIEGEGEEMVEDVVEEVGEGDDEEEAQQAQDEVLAGPPEQLDAVDIQPEDAEHPPWPPVPRQRLLGIGGPPAPRRRKRASPDAIRPTLDIAGRLVSVGEAIKFRLPDEQGGARRGGIMSATVLHMAKKVQALYPTSYNIRTQDRVDMSVTLDHHTAWWVFRGGHWYPGDHPNPPLPDHYPEEDATGDEDEPDAPGGGDAAGAAGGVPL